MEFSWDASKNKSNRKKHGISFEEASEIFNGIVFTTFDDREDYEELREISIGAIHGIVVIVVVHSERDGKTRIISARKATSKESKKYYEYVKDIEETS